MPLSLGIILTVGSFILTIFGFFPLREYRNRPKLLVTPHEFESQGTRDLGFNVLNEGKSTAHNASGFVKYNDHEYYIIWGYIKPKNDARPSWRSLSDFPYFFQEKLDYNKDLIPWETHGFYFTELGSTENFLEKCHESIYVTIYFEYHGQKSKKIKIPCNVFVQK